VLTLAIAKVDSVLSSREHMSNIKLDEKIPDPQSFLRILKDVFSLDLEDDLQNNLKEFMQGNRSIDLNGRKYTKQDLRDLFYTE
jgi:hypothetical protein